MLLWQYLLYLNSNIVDAIIFKGRKESVFLCCGAGVNVWFKFTVFCLLLDVNACGYNVLMCVNFYRHTSGPGHIFVQSLNSTGTFLLLIHKTCGLALLVCLSLFSVLLQRQVLHVCLQEHTGLMAGWQSHFIMCALNTRDSTMWNTKTPHPCTKPGWIILMKHQLIALEHCNKRIFFGFWHCGRI